MSRKCLILESHDYETGFQSEQVQIPITIARRFFGSGTRKRTITVNVFLNPLSRTPSFSKVITISKQYRNGTRRINGFNELESLHNRFIFIEETNDIDVYDIWFNKDKAIVALNFRPWTQGRNSQYNRGRLAIIVDAPARREINRIP